jgi:hypothetical protein
MEDFDIYADLPSFHPVESEDENKDNIVSIEVGYIRNFLQKSNNYFEYFK